MFLRFSFLECGDSSPLFFFDTTWAKHSTLRRTKQPTDPAVQIRPHIDMRCDLKQQRRGMTSTPQRFQESRPIKVSVADIRLDLAVAPLLDVNHRHIFRSNGLDDANNIFDSFRQQQIARIKTEPQSQVLFAELSTRRLHH